MESPSKEKTIRIRKLNPLDVALISTAPIFLLGLLSSMIFWVIASVNPMLAYSLPDGAIMMMFGLSVVVYPIIGFLSVFGFCCIFNLLRGFRVTIEAD